MMTEKIDYVSLDERNAVLFNAENTGYINERVREATLKPNERKRIFMEMAKHFSVDNDKINDIVVRYVNKLRAYEKKHGLGAIPPPSNQNDIERLCKVVGHRFIEIRLSHLRGYRECQRCKKIVRKYKLKG